MRDPGRANKGSSEHNETGEQKQELDRERGMGPKIEEKLERNEGVEIL